LSIETDGIPGIAYETETEGKSFDSLETYASQSSLLITLAIKPVKTIKPSKDLLLFINS
jgi:hypothetical protein